MEIKNPSPTVAFQGTATNQNGAATYMSKEDVQNLRDQIGLNVREQVAAAKAQAAAAKAQAAAQQGVIMVPPTAPRVITIHGRDGDQTIEIPSRAFDNVIPPQAVQISIGFFIMLAAIIIGLPLARAFARRMDRRGTSTEIPREVTNQLAQLNQSVDAIALEVERISEGQRFTTRLLSEQRDLAQQTLPSTTQR
jgi:hypothetical protein